MRNFKAAILATLSKRPGLPGAPRPDPGAAPMTLAVIVENVNRSLMGWVNYFHYRNCNLALEKVKVHAEQRLRKHLMKRHKVKDRGIGEGRFPSATLYRRYGLYKVPTTAGWKSAHASV